MNHARYIQFYPVWPPICVAFFASILNFEAKKCSAWSITMLQTCQSRNKVNAVVPKCSYFCWVKWKTMHRIMQTIWYDSVLYYMNWTIFSSNLLVKCWCAHLISSLKGPWTRWKRSLSAKNVRLSETGFEWSE